MNNNKKEYKGILVCPNNHMYNANKYGSTCPNCGAKQEDKKKTEEEYIEELKLASEEYVCGWLVCTKGINKGRAYEIKPGKNFIGSDPNMDIYIKGDLNIKSRNHSVIVYDKTTRKTILLAGISQGMVYLNQKVVYESVDLEPLNLLEIGYSEFIYVSLCGINFDWSDIDRLQE